MLRDLCPGPLIHLVDVWLYVDPLQMHLNYSVHYETPWILFRREGLCSPQPLPSAWLTAAVSWFLNSPPPLRSFFEGVLWCLISYSLSVKKYKKYRIYNLMHYKGIQKLSICLVIDVPYFAREKQTTWAITSTAELKLGLIHSTVFYYCSKV